MPASLKLWNFHKKFVDRFVGRKGACRPVQMPKKIIGGNNFYVFGLKINIRMFSWCFDGSKDLKFFLRKTVVFNNKFELKFMAEIVFTNGADCVDVRTWIFAFKV